MTHFAKIAIWQKYFTVCLNVISCTMSCYSTRFFRMNTSFRVRDVVFAIDDDSYPTVSCAMCKYKTSYYGLQKIGTVLLSAITKCLID